MSYPKHQPVPEKTMDISNYEGHHSICQTLRDIYHMTDNEDIKLKCRIAVSMAKSMQKKLKWYKENTK